MTMTDEEIQGLIEAHSIAWAVEFQKGNKEEARFCSDTATALRQLQAENKTLKEDKRRMDWLELHDIVYCKDETPLRETIDAALQQEKCDGC